MHPAASRALFDEKVGRFPADLATARGWILHPIQYPIIDCQFTRGGRTPMRLRLDFTDWDDTPPSIQLLSADGAALQSVLQNPTGVYNGSPHPSTGRPFICMAGSREFHIHPSHLNEPWDQFRGKPGFDIGDILDKLWHAWLKGAG